MGDDVAENADPVEHGLLRVGEQVNLFAVAERQAERVGHGKSAVASDAVLGIRRGRSTFVDGDDLDEINAGRRPPRHFVVAYEIQADDAHGAPAPR